MDFLNGSPFIIAEIHTIFSIAILEEKELFCLIKVTEVILKRKRLTLPIYSWYYEYNLLEEVSLG